MLREGHRIKSMETGDEWMARERQKHSDRPCLLQYVTGRDLGEAFAGQDYYFLNECFDLFLELH